MRPSERREAATVRIELPDVALEGELTLGSSPAGIVVFAHGSGSGRHSPRNQRVAAALREVGLATLLFDLLTPEEEAADTRTGHLRFDISLLAGRLAGATAWLAMQPGVHGLPVGYFGASTGGAAALVAATLNPALVSAIVSRGGRPDLAGDALRRVAAPTLLIVGELDPVVLDLNRRALEEIPATRELAVVPRAGHLFEEPGALDEVARLAGAWFGRYLVDALRR